VAHLETSTTSLLKSVDVGRREWITRTRILSITIHDCEVQTFRSGGKGGQNQNKRDSGVRIIHHPSGARGESREERSQLQNKKKAFLRMAESVQMKLWIARFLGQIDVAQIGSVNIRPEDIKIEIRKGGKWTVVNDVDPT
jgi:hypothetical protein